MKERQINILNYLYKHKKATVNTLASLFLVSKETIRKDLNELSKHKIIVRDHGGAFITEKNLTNELVSQSTDININDILPSLTKEKVTKNLLTEGGEMNGKVFVLGSFNVDIVAKVADFPQQGETIVALNSFLCAGGKGSNQAIAASNAGSEVHFVTKVGKDQFSQFAYNNLYSTGIHSFTIFQSETEPTGSALIYVSEVKGENMIAIYPGANLTINQEELNSIQNKLVESNVLLLQLENNFDAILNAAKFAKQNHVTTILNPAPYNKVVLELAPYIDVITPNQTEASLISGIDITDINSAKLAAQKIADLGIATIIITMGGQGALLYNNQKFEHIPIFPAVVVDTTGAGDAFNGALSAQLSKGCHIQQAVYYASAFASLAIEKVGASNMPTELEAKERLNKALNFKSIQ